MTEPVTEATFSEWWASLTEDQRESVRIKARFEGCTLSAVRRDWSGIENDERRLREIARDRLEYTND